LHLQFHILPSEIDEITLNASMKGMQESILKLSAIPQFIIVDDRQLNAKLGQISSAGKKFTIEEIELLKAIPNERIS
jgi:ribonuclease HII